MNRSERLPKVTYLLVLGILLTVTGAGQALYAQTIGSVGAEPLAVQDVSFYSASVDRDMHFEIVLPKDYEDSGKRYPVIYMLHGLTSNYKAWGRMGVPQYLNQFDMIAVIPDAGNSWYVNWSESADGQTNNFDDYITTDLVTYVDNNYRTISRREGRAIIGLSMGGYGGITLGLRHPELFCSIGSHSGALSWAQQARVALESDREPFVTWANRPDNPGRTGGLNIDGFSTQSERTPKGKVFLKPEDADAYDPFKLVLNIPADKLPHIYLDCGTEDGLIKSALQFTKLLTENKIPFTYSQSPGGHVAGYWLREVEHLMS
ncbi:MAG: alpha/beta fold hydrolase, partial [Planctomycetes bacterium]|nr:alpha/beta fold hydrolase [Planctomycetota bacterium]